MEVIKKVDKELSQAVQKIGEKLYSATKEADKKAEYKLEKDNKE